MISEIITANKSIYSKFLVRRFHVISQEISKVLLLLFTFFSEWKENKRSGKLFKTKVQLKQKQKQNCVKTHVGKIIIKSRYFVSKNDRKTYDIKCSKSPFVSNCLKQTMVKKHRSNANEAKLEESKVRMLFSRAKRISMAQLGLCHMRNVYVDMQGQTPI